MSLVDDILERIKREPATAHDLKIEFGDDGRVHRNLHRLKSRGLVSAEKVKAQVASPFNAGGAYLYSWTGLERQEVRKLSGRKRSYPSYIKSTVDPKREMLMVQKYKSYLEDRGFTVSHPDDKTP